MYYTLINNKKKGPFKQEDLLDHLISRSTLVWKEGMDDWVKIKDVTELSHIATKIPPEPPTMMSDIESFVDKTKSKVNTKKLKTGVLLVSFFSIFFYIALGGYALYDLEHTYKVSTYEPDNYYNRNIKDGKVKVREWKENSRIYEDKSEYYNESMHNYQLSFNHYRAYSIILVTYSKYNLYIPKTKTFSALKLRLIIISLLFSLLTVCFWYYRDNIKSKLFKK